MGTANLFKTVRSEKIDLMIQLWSTSEVYSQVDLQNVQIEEYCPLRPSSLYAVSRTVQNHLDFPIGAAMIN